MGLQKYRADFAGEKQSNGATPHYTRWVGGPSLALVRDCPCENDPTLTPRTVYITSEPDTYFSIPAACRSRGKTVRGYLTSRDGDFVFHRYLPWLTGEAFRVLTEKAADCDRDVRYTREWEANGSDPEYCQRQRMHYAAKAARYRDAAARLAARIVRRAVGGNS